MPRPTYRLAILTTRRRFASERKRFASFPCRLISSSKAENCDFISTRRCAFFLSVLYTLLLGLIVSKRVLIHASDAAISLLISFRLCGSGSLSSSRSGHSFSQSAHFSFSSSNKLMKRPRSFFVNWAVSATKSATLYFSPFFCFSLNLRNATGIERISVMACSVANRSFNF